MAQGHPAVFTQLRFDSSVLLEWLIGTRYPGGRGVVWEHLSFYSNLSPSCCQSKLSASRSPFFEIKTNVPAIVTCPPWSL